MTRIKSPNRENNESRFKMGVVASLFLFVAAVTLMQSGILTGQRNVKTEESASPLFASAYSNVEMERLIAEQEQPTKFVLAATMEKKIQQLEEGPLRIAFLGNSLQYYNDCPGMFVEMLRATGYTVTYDACMKGGATLSSLRNTYNGCSTNLQISKDGPVTVKKLLDGKRQWDFVVLQDQSRAPAIEGSRDRSLFVLTRTYAKELYQADTTPVFLQTAGYKNGFHNMTFVDMTQKLYDGYSDYAKAVTELVMNHAGAAGKKGKRSRVAPLGNAYVKVYHQNRKLWQRLYIEDGVHPSPSGTWLQACVLYATIVGKEPPTYDATFWKAPTLTAPRPTVEEARELRDVALRVTGFMDEQQSTAENGRNS